MGKNETKKRHGDPKIRYRILQFLKRNEYTPSYAEIGAEVGLSKKTVHVYLKDMEAAGEVAFTDSQRPRAYIPR